MNNWLKSLFISALTLFVVLHILFYYCQRFITLPGWINRTANMPCNCVMTTEDNRTIYGQYYKHPTSKNLILYSHGNAGNLNHWKILLEPLKKYGNILIYDYGGYGASEGNPSEESFKKDVTAVYEHSINVLGYSPESVVWYGRSIGTVVAAWGAQKYGGEKLVLETPLSNLKSAVFHHAPLPLKGVALMLKDEFDLVKLLEDMRKKDLNIPTYVIRASEDRLIPITLTEKVDEYATEKIMVATGHNDVSSSSIYWKFMDKVLLGKEDS